ncbi:MAG TPA: glycosyltransferase family 2 protein [Candidatus Aphodoplasma excrementigallinarum]|uniref:Glycosyltransferase family 2 protein n=1 Tax=Candidatus Aphodoplasma excrementigallinarum TaxID=2840673 RepID=A0A9D1T057_9FIRM|nr:glycosyltransferase family 2 protein [Candidatus Aphodoplasma excrementigallinarum]
MIRYSIIVPLYNEELVIEETYKRLTEVMQSTKEPYELVFVNDGSRDKTEQLAKEILARDKHVCLINFSRNFGHQTAITAGMDNARGQAVVVIDADLQDPPEVILQMIEKWKQGYDVVYGKRLARKGETAFKKVTAKVFYRFLSSMTNIDIPTDTGDFRLIDRKVCDAMKTIEEKNRYIRGLVSWVGFKQTSVEYVREERFAGETKYPLKKMLKFASDAITSFSDKPLRIAAYLGNAISLVSFLYLLYVVIRKLTVGDFGEGWASIVAISLFFNGVVLIVLGIIGEYIGRIYDECKNRPLYIIDEKIGFEERNDVEKQ